MNTPRIDHLLSCNDPVEVLNRMSSTELTTIVQELRLLHTEHLPPLRKVRVNGAMNTHEVTFNGTYYAVTFALSQSVKFYRSLQLMIKELDGCDWTDDVIAACHTLKTHPFERGETVDLILLDFAMSLESSRGFTDTHSRKPLVKRIYQAVRSHLADTSRQASGDTIHALLDQQYLINAWTGRYSQTEFVALLRAAFAAEASRGGG